MKKMDMERMLLSLFKEDFHRNEEFSHISQLTVITIKSLMPMINEQAIRVDYIRFSEEINLWEYYRNGDNSSLLNIQGRVDPHIYWNQKDSSIISRLIPLVLVNTEYRVVEDEIIKNTIFSTGNLQTLFESISLGYLLYLIINNEKDIIDKLKEQIIGFSQIDFISKYEEYYKIDIKDYLGNFKVEFEKTKIHLLNTLNGIRNNIFANLEDCINTLKNEKSTTFVGAILYDFLYNPNADYNIPKFYMSLGDYIIKLRKGRVDPEQLQINEYILPDIFSLKQGEVFFHSLLKESKVIKKEVKDNHLTSLVQTRTGMYLFKK